MSFMERIWRIFLPFVLGYLFTSIFRTVNAMLSPEMGESASISPVMFGFMTSLFFLSSGLMQLPVGILVDRYGPRRVQASMFLIAGIGSILFGASNWPILLMISRFLIGFGMAGGIVTAYAANHIWFNKQESLLLNSMLYSIGTLGSLISSWPVYALLQWMNWHVLAIFLGIFVLLLAVWILLVVPDPQKTFGSVGVRSQLGDLKIIYTSAYFWRVAPLSIFVYGTFLSFQTYWVVPYLMHVNGLSKFTTSIFLLVMAFALLISPLVARIINKWGPLWKSKGDWIAGIGAFLAIVFQMLIGSNVFSANIWLWGSYAFFVGFTILLYSNLNAYFKSLYDKKSAVALNVFLFLSVFVLQFLYGVFASFWKTCTPSCGLIGTFWIYIVLQWLSLIWFCFGKNRSYE